MPPSTCDVWLSSCRGVPKPVLHTGVEAQPEKAGSPRLSTAEIARRACEAQRDPLLHQSSSGWFARPLYSPSFNTFNSASSFELSTAGKPDHPLPLFAAVACQQPCLKERTFEYSGRSLHTAAVVKALLLVLACSRQAARTCSGRRAAQQAA